MADIELFHFEGSHYNEKARWALDLKRVAHRRTPLLPGPHIPKMMKLTGKTTTPALRIGDETIGGSAAIIERLEADFPEPPLFPADDTERAQAVEIVREFDAEVGVAVRLAKFFEAMEAGAAVGAFAVDRSPLVKAGYYLMFPAVWQAMKRKMSINEPAAIRARERTLQAFDFVAKRAAATGYLVGDRFSVADLTAAALLMPAVRVTEWGGPREADTERNLRWLESWADHPGAEWVREMYRRHRKPQ